MANPDFKKIEAKSSKSKRFASSQLSPRPNFKKLELRWQKKWERAKLFEAEPDQRKKFFTSIVIPYPSGDPHLGHARTYSRTDILVRFKRMRGYNVLNPIGFHATGNRAIVFVKSIKEGDKKTIDILKNLYNCKDSDIKKLTTPKKLVSFFIKRSISAFKSAGFAIDWRRKFSSIDAEFCKFITWQFETLREKGYIAKSSHPVIWCPSCESPITQADRAKGEEAIIQEIIVWKCPLESGVILPAATLRPETIFAWTNMYLNPGAEYVIAKVKDERWVLSRAAAERMKKQRDDIIIIDEIVPEEIIGKKFQNPATKEWLLVLPGEFVDPNISTGVVASEPSDAPDDHIALEELKKRPDFLRRYNLKPSDIERIKYKGLIDVPEYGKFSGVEICRRMKITSLEQTDKLLEAKNEAYRVQYHRGKLTKIAGKLAGKTIPEAIEAVKKQYISKLDVLHEPSEKVVCKCGTDCYIKIFKDQWFLRYGDEKWKKRVKKYIDGELKIYPKIWRKRFDAALDWTQNKACARRYGLGTPLPWDKSWVIETLSDSTIYMSYYIISKYANSKKLKAGQMNKQFFDYVLLGKGSKSTELMRTIRSDFEYWYPMDWRNSAKDLVSNHLLYFLYNHIAIFPRRYWPKVISVNGFVNISGEKMSKSRGRAITFNTAIERYGADVIRTVMSTAASPEQDSDFREEEAKNLVCWQNNFYNLVIKLSKAKLVNEVGIDKWLISRTLQNIESATENLERLFTRNAAQNIFYAINSDFKWYLRRNSSKISRPVRELVNDWVKMVSLYMPHVCEELWSKLGNKRFISTADWPKVDKSKIDKKAEQDEQAIQKAVEDIRQIKKLVKGRPKAIYLYVIPKELEIYAQSESFFSKEMGLKTRVFALNDSKKYDPKNKATKAKPGRPAIYLE